MGAPCATCPWLKENHQKPHPSGWYKVGNLRRLWNGMRTGKAPGMICHATDPESIEYGGGKKVKAGHERECLGANALIQRELNVISTYKDFRLYRREHPDGLTKPGLAEIVARVVFNFSGRVIETADPNDPNDKRIALPWR